MKERNPDNSDLRPKFFDERNVPAGVAAPAELVGVYRFSRQDKTPAPDRKYIRQGVLSSEGWVPPVSKQLAHTVSNAGDGPNDISVIGNYTVGKATRVAVDPRELRSQLSDQGTIVADDVTSVYGTQYSDTVEIYIPDGLDSDGIANYLRDCVRPATRYYLDTHAGEHPSRDEIADVLIDAYDISRETAHLTVESASDE